MGEQAYASPGQLKGGTRGEVPVTTGHRCNDSSARGDLIEHVENFRQVAVLIAVSEHEVLEVEEYREPFFRLELAVVSSTFPETPTHLVPPSLPMLEEWRRAVTITSM